MGLDVYVGPLTRYYSFEWETILQQAGREQGMDVHIVRPDGCELTPTIKAHHSRTRRSPFSPLHRAGEPYL